MNRINPEYFNALMREPMMEERAWRAMPCRRSSGDGPPKSLRASESGGD